MESLGVVLLISVLVVAAVLSLMMWRRRRPAPGQPRTVADLVRLRGDAVGEAVVTDSDRLEEATPAVVLPRTPVDALDPLPDPVAEPGPARHRLVGAGLAVADGEVRKRIDAAGRSTTAGVGAPEDAKPAPASELVGDTPWARAARMDVGVVVPAARSASPAPAEMHLIAVQQRSNSNGVHLDRVPDDQDPAAASRSVSDRLFLETPGPVEPPTAAPVDEELPAGAVTGPADLDAVEPAAVDPVAVEPVAVEPAAVEPAAVEPVAARDADPESVTADAPPSAEQPVPTADVPTAARAAGRVRRRPADTAAEQAAADLALLRTFGIAGPPGRAAEPDDDETELAVRTTGKAGPAVGAAQAVHVHVVGRTGDGLAGAVVTLHDDLGRETASVPADADGRATLTAPYSGGYILVAVSDGHQPGAAALTVDTGAVEAEIVLTRSATVSGTLSGEDGPQAGAHIVLVQDGETLEATTTGSDGAYRFGDLTAGEYGLSVTVPDCEPAAVLVHVSDEQQVRRDIELEPAGLPADVVGSPFSRSGQ